MPCQPLPARDAAEAQRPYGAAAPPVPIEHLAKLWRRLRPVDQRLVLQLVRALLKRRPEANP
jgi:hypothetical protein